jgi:hypothetical protein
MRPGCINRHSDLLFSVVLCDKRTKVRSNVMERQNDGSGGVGWGVCCGHGGNNGVGWGDGCGAGEDAGGAVQGQQVILKWVFSPTVTDENIALLRQDIRAKKMQVTGQNMSLLDTEAQKFWPIYKHYADDLHEVNNSKYVLLKRSRPALSRDNVLTIYPVKQDVCTVLSASFVGLWDGPSVGNRHFNLRQQRHDLLRLVSLHRYVQLL